MRAGTMVAAVDLGYEGREFKSLRKNMTLVVKNLDALLSFAETLTMEEREVLTRLANELDRAGNALKRYWRF